MAHFKIAAISIFLALTYQQSVNAAVRLINMVPEAQSNEKISNSHPSLAIDPTNRQRFAAWARTEDPKPPFFDNLWVSTNRGATWSLSNSIPPQYSNASASVGFNSTGSLFVGVDENGVSGFRIYRTENFSSSPNFVRLTSEFIDAVSGAQILLQKNGTAERLLMVATEHGEAVSASIANANASTAGLLPRTFINKRSNSFSGSNHLPLASHADGTSYTVFRGNRVKLNSGPRADIIVFRDVVSAANRFDNLVGADKKIGVVVVSSQPSYPAQFFETDSQTAIAVDPRNSKHVVIVFQEGLSIGGSTLHLRRSTDGGRTWSADLRAVRKGKNPSVAFNSAGRLAFMYQVEDAGRLITTLEESDSAFVTSNGNVVNQLSNAAILFSDANNPQDAGPRTVLVADGLAFIGVFASPNTPIQSNFPAGVVYQRKVNWNNKTLLGTNGGSVISPSFDPFLVISEP